MWRLVDNLIHASALSPHSPCVLVDGPQLYINAGYATPLPTSLPTKMPTEEEAELEVDGGNLTQFVLKKYQDLMDPIVCGAKNCWLRIGGAYDMPDVEDRDRDKKGAFVFPIIQNTDERCQRCDGVFNKGSANKVCNKVDLEYLMYFNAETPHLPASIKYNRTDFKHFNEQNSGVDGLFYLNMYWGVEFLNKLSCRLLY